MERIIKFESHYARRPRRQSVARGTSELGIRFVLKGDAGAVQFLICTNWRQGRALFRDWEATAIPADLGYHSRTPRFEGQVARPSCEFLDGAPCYYDGSALNAEEAMRVLVDKGDEALWKYLEDYYQRVFGEKVV